jgi:hypothetical protein
VIHASPPSEFSKKNQYSKKECSKKNQTARTSSARNVIAARTRSASNVSAASIASNVSKKDSFHWHSMRVFCPEVINQQLAVSMQ